MMADETVIITLSDRDPLAVNKQRLVESSSRFTYIFVECAQTEHDMSDFTPGIVEMFLTLLEDRVVEEIAESAFRDLHKISVVFDVGWLIKSCREWLLKKIKSVGENTGSETLLYLFEECFYLYSKWNVKRYMEALILEVRFQDTTLFLSRYILENNDILNTNQLKNLLYLAGANTDVILEILLDRLNRREHLDDITRYLIEHINLSFCAQQNGSLYHEMCERLTGMKDISNDDFRLVFKLTTVATKEIIERKSISTETIVRSVRSLVRYWDDCTSLTDITRLEFADHEGMFEVLTLLKRAAFANKFTIDPEEIEGFIERLEKLELPKVSTKYIDMISEHIDASTLSSNDITQHLIKILRLIRTNEKLSSSYDTICLKGERMPQSLFVNSLKGVLGLAPTPDRYVFKMKLPGVTCNRTGGGECGFIIERKGREYVLLREASTYTYSSVHIHDELKAENMKLCYVYDTENVRWFLGVPAVGIFKIKGMRVFYNISDNLVAKF